MKQKNGIQEQFKELPPEAQRQVADYIAFLRERYTPSRFRKASKKIRLAAEPFIGMWRDRVDLKDSTAWVRNLREREWATPDE